MKSSYRLLAALVATVVLSAVAIGGVVLAQTPSPSPKPSAPGASPSPGSSGQRGAMAQAQADDALNHLAGVLKVPRSTLDSALKDTAKYEVEKQVTAGNLTRSQADQIEQKIDSSQFPAMLGGLGGFGHFEIGKNAGALGACLKGAQNGGTPPSQATIKSCLDQQVASGNLTQNQENAILQRIQNRQNNPRGPRGRDNGQPGASPSPKPSTSS